MMIVKGFFGSKMLLLVLFLALLAVGHKWKQPCEVYPELMAADCKTTKVADMSAAIEIIGIDEHMGVNDPSDMSAAVDSPTPATVTPAQRGELHLKVTSSYREWREQARIYCNAMMHYGNAKVVASIVAIPGKSAHQSGMAVDLKIVDADGKPIDMPPHRTDLGRATSAQMANINTLKRVMEAAGFTSPHWDREWWHFELKARVAAGPEQFDCKAWRNNELAAPQEPTDLVTGHVSQWSGQVRLTQPALTALQTAERHLSSGQ
jgi:hypothetical protein